MLQVDSKMIVKSNIFGGLVKIEMPKKMFITQFKQWNSDRLTFKIAKHSGVDHMQSYSFQLRF